MAIVINTRPGDYCWSGNPVLYNLSSTEAAGDATIYFEVKVKFKYIGGSYVTLATVPFYPVAGVAKVDISAILESKLNFFIPDLSILIQQTAGEQSGMFYIETRQISTAIPDPSFDSDSAHEKCVVKGGLNYFFHRGNNYFPNYQTLSGNNKFLTWQKSGKLASYTEQMYLCLINAMSGDTETRTLLTTVHYTDGTTDTTSFAFTQNKGVVMFLPAGADQLDLQSLDPSKTIYKWVHQVLFDPGSGFEALTEAFTYYLDNRNDYNDQVMNYRNSLGGLDSMRVRGIIETNLAWDSIAAQRGVDPDYYTGLAIQAQQFTVSSIEKITYKGDAGFLEKEQQERLRDMFIYRELYRVLRGKWLPLNLISSSFKMRTSDDTLWSMPIEYQPAYIGGNFYTPESVDLGDE